VGKLTHVLKTWVKTDLIWTRFDDMELLGTYK